MAATRCGSGAARGRALELAAHLNAGLCRFLERVLEHDRRWGGGGPEVIGYGQWLSWRCGVSGYEAREYIRVARRLPELPLIKEAFACGELSYAKVRLLTWVGDPRDEEGLLELAGRLTTAQLQRIVQLYRRVTSEEAVESQQRSFLDYWWDEDGSLLLRGRLPAEDGALLVRALQPPARRCGTNGGRKPKPPSRRRPWRRSRSRWKPFPDPLQLLARPTNVDALVAVADAALANEAQQRSDADRYQVERPLDADAHSSGDIGGTSTTAPPSPPRPPAGSPAMPPSSRSPNATGNRCHWDETRLSPLRRALPHAPSCQFPGCDHTHHLHAHHLRHWAQGGNTNLHNLILLCGAHHRLLHEHGYRAQRAPQGQLRFYHPWGQPIHQANPPRTHPQALSTRNHRDGLKIDANTAQNGTGEQLDDFTYVADAFLHHIRQRE